MDKEYQMKLVDELYLYPRIALFVLREADFRLAKRFFGEDRYQVCLMEMVLCDDCYVYLKEFINSN